MFLSGDIEDDDNTFEWIPFADSIEVILTEPDGTKDISVRFRNNEQIESLEITRTIILDRLGPVIQRVGVFDASDRQDVDGIFHAGESLQIEVTEAAGKDYFDGTVRIVSTTRGFDSGLNPLTFVDGEYNFLWATDGLSEGEDYIISMRLFDDLGRTAESSATVVLDNTPPAAPSFLISEGASFTNSRVVPLDFSFSSDAVNLFIDGDVIDSPLTRQWIDVRARLSVTLTDSNGLKTVNVRVRDTADNESLDITRQITLSQGELQILEVSAFDFDNPSDADGIYHSGQQIAIEVLVVDALEGLDATIRLTSAKAKYDSQQQTLSDEGEGKYQYVWDTSGLNESDDYQVSLRLSNGVGSVQEDNSLVFTLDNTPPQNFRLSVVGVSRTASRNVVLNLEAEGASQMRITGDVVAGAFTLDWVDYVPSVSVELVPGDGEKVIEATLRDDALNESVTEKVNLDTTPPSRLSVRVNKTSTPGSGQILRTNETKLSVSIEAFEATQIVVEGNLQPSDVTFQLIPFTREIEVELTPEDGQKTITVRFVDDVGNESIADAEVVLDRTPPEIVSVISRNLADLADADGQYRSGSDIEIVVTGSEIALLGEISLHSVQSETSASDEVEYNSGIQSLTDVGDGTYTFVWKSPIFLPGTYQVSVELIDAAGNNVEDNKTRIILDDTPPIAPSFLINDGAAFTNSRSVTLSHISPFDSVTLSLDIPSDAVNLFVDGDVVDGPLIRQWIDVRDSLTVTLTDSNGLKTVTMQLRDAAENQSSSTSRQITLSQGGPKISEVSSFDLDFPTDADGIYHSGQQIVIAALIVDSLEGLDVFVRIASAKVGYDSGEQALTDEGGGRYRYVFDTVTLQESDDYQVSLRLSNGVGDVRENDLLTLILDNTPPEHLGFSIVNGQATLAQTATEQVVLNLEAVGASQMRITGDVVAGTSTFDWVNYTRSVSVDLVPGDGEKVIEAELRDEALNESTIERVSVFLDTTPPSGLEVIPLSAQGQVLEGNITNETKLLVSISAFEAPRIFVGGDVQPSDFSLQLIPFADEVEVELTPEEGQKTITVRFVDDVGNESTAQAVVTLDKTPPEIASVSSRDLADPTDDDGQYSSQVSEIEIVVNGLEAGLSGNVTITSEQAGFSDENQPLQDVGDGTYTFVWESFGLPTGLYRVSVELVDTAGNRVMDNKTLIILDNTPPVAPSFLINDGVAFTNSRSVTLSLILPFDAVNLFIDGDVIDGPQTRQWIDIPDTNLSGERVDLTHLEITLTASNGLKTIDVKVRDAADNESLVTMSKITLSQDDLTITKVSSFDFNIPTDADGIYHSGQQVAIEVLVADALEGLDASIRIASEKVSYDSGEQRLTDEGDGIYRYVWDTQPQGSVLQESDDYQVTFLLSDGVGHVSEVSADTGGLVLTLDNTPPQPLPLEILGTVDNPLSIVSGLDDRTASVNVVLSFPADEHKDASEIRITGDVVADANTFDWIPYTNSVPLQLLPGDGDKSVEVELRDLAENISDTAQINVFLDTTPPQVEKVEIGKREEEGFNPITLTNETQLQVRLQASDVDQVFVHGDVEPSDTTFQFIPFPLSQPPPAPPPTRVGKIPFRLLAGDGQKTVIVGVRDAVGNESETQTDIVLDQTPPEVRDVQSRNTADSTDADGRYRPGSVIEIIVTGSEPGLSGNVTIASEEVGYNSEVQPLSDAGTDTYAFVWETQDLTPAQYRVSVELVDPAGNRVQKDDDILTLTEDTIVQSATLNDEELFTEIREVSLQVVAPDASEMLIDGDVEDSAVTRTFIPFTSPVELVLSRGDGTKNVSVQLRDGAGVDLGSVSTSITLDAAPPVITDVSAFVRGGAESRFRAGEQVALVITAAALPLVTEGGETGLDATLRIRSQSTGYDSGEQTAGDNGDGTYTFIWDTVGLDEADDYRVEGALTDSVEHTDFDDSLVLQIDNTPPQNPSIEVHALDASAEIRDGETTRVKARSVQISYTSEEATELFVDGDLITDSNTRVWIPLREEDGTGEIIVNLTPGDGAKTIQVRFRDEAQNETGFVSETVELDALPPIITSVFIDNRDLISSDFFFQANQTVQIEIQTEPEATVFVRVQSESQEYDTDEQAATPIEGSSSPETIDKEDGSFQYFWETHGLNDSDDYTITIIAQDLFGRSTERSATVVLDTVAPENPIISIERGQALTADSAVQLFLSAQQTQNTEAIEMFISGDVVADSQTFQWTPFQERIQVLLTPGDGEKEIIVSYRDEAENETSPVSSTIILDTVGPDSIAIRVQGEVTVTNSRDIILELEAERGFEMFIDGAIVRDVNTHRWIPFVPELPVKLSNSDGEKRIGAQFRSGEENETQRIEALIVLDRQSPEILNMRSLDNSDSSDDDGVYQPGQQIQVVAQSELGIDCALRITGEGYDSGEQEIDDTGGGIYRFIWRTENLNSGSYSVRWQCTDAAENQAENDTEIMLDDTGPVDTSVEFVNDEPDGSNLISSPSVTLRLNARDAVEMFVSGDVVNDTNTFQWISYTEDLIVNLAGRDGEKTVSVRFRSAARVESEEVTARVIIDTARPRLLEPVNLFEATDGTGGVVVLSFDEDIQEIDLETFQLSFKNPFLPGSEIGLDAVNVKSEVSFGKLKLNLSAEQVKSIRELQGLNPTQSVIQASLAEGSVLDSVGKGNLPADAIRLVIARLADLPLATVENMAFSPNADGLQDTVRLTYALPADGFVTVEVRDAAGLPLVTLQNGFQAAGVAQNVTWDGRDVDGELLTDGLYQLELSIFDTGIGVPIGLRSWQIILDNRPPTIVEVEPKDKQTLVGVLQFRLTASDGGSVPSGIAEAFLEGEFAPISPTAPLTGGTQIPLVPIEPDSELYQPPAGVILRLPDGENRLTVVVRDSAGNETQLELTYSVSSSALLTFINYPNPVTFGQGTRLRYVLEQPVIEGRIRAFDAAGELVYFKELEPSQLGVGQTHEIEWDVRDLFGNSLPRGVYFAILQLEGLAGTSKINHKIAVR